MATIEGKNWHTEVQTIDDDRSRDAIRKDFYEKRATLKSAVAANAIPHNTMEKTRITAKRNFLFGVLKEHFGDEKIAYSVLNVVAKKGIDGKGNFNVDRFFKGWTAAIVEESGGGYLVKYDAKGNEQGRAKIWEGEKREEKIYFMLDDKDIPPHDDIKAF